MCLKLYILKQPTFLRIDPKVFTLDGFQPPTSGHHTDAPASNFLASQTANTTIRWRRDPNDLKMIQSNARIIRWSDGSLTLQIGSDPMEQYDLPGKPLAPPQAHPVKPTPTSLKGVQAKNATYDARLDSHTYLVSVHNEVGFAQITNHVTASLVVQSTTDENDDALVRLQENMAAAIRETRDGRDEGIEVIAIQEDPELAKKRAEVAEREKNRAEKRRQNQAERERERQNRVLGRAGIRSGYSAADMEAEGGYSRSKPKAPRKPRRRNSEYSEDEEDYRKGKTREDEYDEDDGFLVGSDVEPEVVGDDSDEEAEFGEDRDAEGEDDDEVVPVPSKSKEGGDEAVGRSKRRKVVDEDDDDE